MGLGRGLEVGVVANIGGEGEGAGGGGSCNYWGGGT